ncbi:MAG: hypothetical protein MTP17_01235 [Candidatus Midichloria sp.]|nr:MAG: hypothetical protein MTP17_01235 [Candidatus Midichloria sp.]
MRFYKRQQWLYRINTPLKNITSALSKNSSDSQLFNHIINYLSEKQDVRSPVEDEELLWLLKNDRSLYKILLDNRIFDPSSIGILSKKTK